MRYLVTGGAGSIGSNLITHLLLLDATEKVIAFDNNEYGLSLLPKHSKLKSVVGDVRDKDRIERLLSDVEAIIHCAAIKRIEMANWNVQECIKTNVLGTMNLLQLCRGEKLLLVSSDKAVPTDEHSLYGATKYLQEKLVLAANKEYVSGSVARMGNVMGTRGDVLEIWQRQHDAGEPLTITDEKMKRFFWSMTEATEFIIRCLTLMQGGEIFVPKMREYTLMDLMRQHFPGSATVNIGSRCTDEARYHRLMSPLEEERAKEFEWGWIIGGEE